MARRIWGTKLSPNKIHSFWALCIAALITACSPAADNQKTLALETNDRADGKTEVIVLGMIHGGHRTSDKYSLERLRTIVRDIEPDVILTEIPPDRVDEAIASFKRTGEVTEERTRAFPEYTDVIIPLQNELGFWLVGTAGWTREIADKRAAVLDAIAKDPVRKEQWDAHLKAREEFEETAKGRSDDPLFIHSDAFDELVQKSYQPYMKYFEADLGPSGWAGINGAHMENISKALDSIESRGKRVLITYGSAHKYWILRELSKRSDVVILDPIPFFTKNTAAETANQTDIPDQ